MIPHTLVLEPGLVVHKIYMGYWFFGRPTVEDLRQDLRAVLEKCRPDWDIGTPGLKAAWQEGRKAGRSSSTLTGRATRKPSANRTRSWTKVSFIEELVALIEARRVCERAHRQLKEELGLDHFGDRPWTGLHRHALVTSTSRSRWSEPGCVFGRGPMRGPESRNTKAVPSLSGEGWHGRNSA
jgi:hypothetical protein